MSSSTNIVGMIFRIGLILLVCGTMVGLLFGKWTVMLVVGILFTFSPIIQKGIQLRKENMIKGESIT